MLVFKKIKCLSRFVWTLAMSGVTKLSIAAEVPTSSIEFNSGLNIDSLLQVFMALLGIILIIVALSYILKKFNMVPGGTTGLIKVISGLALNNKDRLLLVQVGDEQILLSVSPGNINKVHKLSNLVNVEQSSIATKEDKFSKLLESVVTGKKK